MNDQESNDPNSIDIREEFSRIKWNGPVFIKEMIGAGNATHYLIREEDRNKLPKANGIPASGMRTLPEDSAANTILSNAFFNLKQVYVSTDIRLWWIGNKKFVWRTVNVKIAASPI